MTEQTPKTLGIDDAVQLVATMVNNGELDQAMSLAEQLGAAAPDHPDVLYVSAGLWWRVDENDRAIAMQKRLVALEPSAATHHERLLYFLRETGDVLGALVAAQVAVQECPSNPTLINAFGLSQLDTGDLQGSQQTFENAIQTFPENLTAHQNLSLVLLAEGRAEDAVNAFSRGVTPLEAVQLKANNQEQKHLSKTYDGLAECYDTNDLQRSWGQQTAQVIRTAIGQGNLGDVLDLCCGTGSVGAAITAQANHLTGIDLSPGMLDKAKARNVYDELIVADINTALLSIKRSFFTVTCSVALYHWADLGPFFYAAARVLAPSGHLIFSVDPVNDELDIGQSAPGEYAHSRAYIRRVTADAGLREISITIDLHRAYPGFWCVFQRPA
jgi:predicted TPR repeat methyltransferase